jgi:hypothetical protein
MKFVFFSSSIAAASAAQSVLRAGDCAVVAVKTDDPDHFSVVLTRALKEGDVLYATDAGISQNAVTHRYWQWTRKGWYWTIEQKTVTYKTAEEFYGNGGFREVSDKSWYSYEGFGKFVTPRGGLAAGSIITSEMFETSMKKDGLTHGKLMLSNAGDQVFIFNGPMKEVQLTRREQCGTTRQPYKQSYSQKYSQRYCSRSRWGRCRQYSYRTAYRTATRTAYRNIPKYCNKVYGKRIQPVHKETNKVNFLCGATTSVQGYASYSWSSTHTKTPPGLAVHKTTVDLRACTSSKCTHVRHYDNWMYKGSTSGTREDLLKKINAAPYLNRGRNTQWKWTNSGNVAKAYPQAIKNMRWNVLMKVHCMVSQDYGECSVPCGPGTKTKTVIQYAANGGNQCKKSDLAPVSCNLGSCSEAPTMAPTNAPTNFCDASNCNNWDCAAWCKCYDEESVETYTSNGCADDGDTSCVCFEGKDVSDDEHRVKKLTAEKTTKSFKHQVSCGRHNPHQCKEKDRWVTDLNEKHEVRCCSDGKPKIKVPSMKHCANPHNPGPKPVNGKVLPGIEGVWGMSKVGAKGKNKFGKCIHKATYDEAVAACDRIDNGRLCTVNELKNECTSWTGCNHDTDLIWTLPQLTIDRN